MLKDKAQEYIKDTICAGVVQNFEFTYELSWKYVQRYLEINNQYRYDDSQKTIV
ncbi:MAG: nucleotidyltransferase substrate binding protein [Endomicrobium sp.]|nr:nucleotidyltransferase substrate binding protein [Endomicrobium sp.]